MSRVSAKHATASNKPTTGYLEFYRYQFRKYNDDPKNKLKPISVPHAGQKYGAEWKALSTDEKRVWTDKAEKKNSKLNHSTNNKKRKRGESVKRASAKSAKKANRKHSAKHAS